MNAKSLIFGLLIFLSVSYTIYSFSARDDTPQAKDTAQMFNADKTSDSTPLNDTESMAAVSTKSPTSAPVHWRKTLWDDYMTSIESMDFAQLQASLGVYSEATSTFVMPAGITQSPNPPVVILRILNDPRVFKMYEHLSELPPLEADGLASSSFDMALDLFIAKWTDPEIVGAPPISQEHSYAVAASLFLVAEFCDGPTLVEKIDAWRDWSEAKFSEAQLGEISSRFFDGNGKPDALFLVNLLLQSYMHESNATPEETEQRLRQFTDFLSTEPFREFEERIMLRWDTKREIFTEIEDLESETLARIPVIPDWSSTDFINDTDGIRRVVIDELVSWLDR